MKTRLRPTDPARVAGARGRRLRDGSYDEPTRPLHSSELMDNYADTPKLTLVKIWGGQPDQRHTPAQRGKTTEAERRAAGVRRNGQVRRQA